MGHEVGDLQLAGDVHVSLSTDSTPVERDLPVLGSVWRIEVR
jgi:hypothetical protein